LKGIVYREKRQKMKTIPEVEQKLKEILVRDLEIAPEIAAKVDAETGLLGRGIGLDSMETLSLVTGIEQEFEVEVEDEELTTGLFQTLGTLTEYVIKKLREAD
jgi:acyl carrier protein